MTTEEKLQKIKEYCEQTIRNCDNYPDKQDFNIYEISGGNIDDAYSIGTDEGSTWVSKDILEIINK